MALSDAAMTWFGFTSSALYVSTVVGQVRRYGLKSWRELGYGTGVDAKEFRTNGSGTEFKADHLI
jgi:hypothetical protein